MNEQVREQASQLFNALSHPTRLQIVELLCNRECTVNEIAAELNLSQSSTSQHLAVLTRAGLLKVQPHGVSRIYRIRGPRIERILTLIAEFCEVHDLWGTGKETAMEFFENEARSTDSAAVTKEVLT